ncbi:probable glutathione S-transferase parC [Neltuma alba]|uniref:probable glutathione S-transferase parC n=1 Tax=Neltuma alba TaxID=207710 RepID=UPI0010A5487C|nr:probable glutathione S-transferase parC [Prosopis alba]
MAEQEVVLLDEWLSMFGSRARIALAEKGIKYEFREEDLSNNSPLLLQMNPIHKKIPVLIHKGKPICESLIIVEYIDEVWKDTAPLLPSDPYLRAQDRFWADFVNKKVGDVGGRIWAGKKEEHEEAKKEIIENLKRLEETLGDKTFFGGKTFGFVDVALVPFYPWFYTYEALCNFKVETHCPKLISWAQRCIQRQSVSKSLAAEKEIYDFVVDFRKKSHLD